ncbi:MAG: hypothetical protein UT39_C0001G0071 [Candidatus Woesebacteria bacterium GW2011_GWA1_39_21]|uniref:Carrier domain-containing protein n=1 Tax=Candidatus Woesebacteria bacterium GW2011_GWA1_39_21 TaxID=1618550 RepID=A0A0G0NGR5_9BACT|nr:MAG: hypothetical protein UT39_C0001G0071 [Candidatus Woesebacteria bacterium GW2011_GWA1_39_21]
MNEEGKHTKVENIIKRKLSEYLGIDVEDIATDDSLKEDLHMSPAEISDFLNLLATQEIKTDFSEIQKIQCISDIIDTIVENEEF